MPRQLSVVEPKIINSVDNKFQDSGTLLEVATGNQNKLQEIRRILTDYRVEGKSLKIEEIQSTDPYKVAQYKAYEAYKANGYNPIFIEETSLEIFGLNGRPGPYVKDFTEEVEMRRMIAEVWLAGRDRRAKARVLFAIHDGEETHLFEGTTTGTIAEELRGANGFGWDDMFIPAGETRTFAELSDEEKDQYSMRRKALENIDLTQVRLHIPVFQIPEPYEQELSRVNLEALQDEDAMRFAYALECLENDNTPNSNFTAEAYPSIQIVSDDPRYYLRFVSNADTPSIGLILTDVDRSNLKMHRNGTPYLWQFGPERRFLALAQRADFYLENQAPEVIEVLDALESGEMTIPSRNNFRSTTVESVLGINQNNYVTSTYSFKDLGYRKRSSPKYVSRTLSATTGLYNMIGKYPRSVLSIGSMPAISGWRDVLVTAAIGHHAIFTHRNSIYAGYIEKQASVIRAAKETLANIGLSEKAYQRAARNIGAAIGCSNVKDELASATYLYEEAGVRLFRIYTINSDPRVIEVAEAIRQKFGDKIELFVGQITDKQQAIELIAPNVRADGLFFGHGGGRQCTSATNGMAVTTLEEIYNITTDPRFNETTIAVEGGVGSQIGHLFLMGVDLVSYNQQLAKCVIEQGDIYFQHQNGKICMPYHGSASAPTMIIESANSELAMKRLRNDGRTRNVEGKAGYRYFAEKANSMAFYVHMFKHHAARTLADLGMVNFAELREFMQHNSEDLLRVVSSQASAVADAYQNSL